MTIDRCNVFWELGNTAYTGPFQHIIKLGGQVATYKKNKRLK